MRLLSEIRERVSALVFKAREERELDEELQFHLEEAARAHEAAGRSPAEAYRLARLEFGGVERTKEEVRTARGTRGLEDLWQDIRYGLRGLRRTRAFTAVAVLSLGLGIGANAAVFSLMNALMLTSLPVPNPDRLRVVMWRGQGPKMTIWGGTSSSGRGSPTEANVVSYPVFAVLRDRTRGEAELFGMARLSEVTVQRRGVASLANGLMVSDNFFEGLGAGASLGRVFTSADADPAAAQWVVLSHAWWQARFGADPQVVGTALNLNGKTFVVAGVLPAGLRGLYAGDHVDFYVPMSAQPALAPQWDRNAQDRWWIQAMARLAPGVDDGQFRAVAQAAFANTARSMVEQPELAIYHGSTGLRAPRLQYREPLFLLLGIVGVVILIACANLAGLSLARSANREHEVSIRRSLGASRGRLLRLSLTESVLLGLLGGAAALPVAFATKGGLARLLFASTSIRPTLDLRVFAFTLGLALLTGVLTGLAPALRWSRAEAGMRVGGIGAAGVPSRLGRLFVVAQMALSIVLLTTAGLFGRTLVNLGHTELGFDADNLLVFRVDAGAAGYEGVRVNELYGDLTTSLAAVPGVLDVGVSQMPLLTGWMSGGTFFTLPDFPDATAPGPVLPGQPASDQPGGPSAYRHVVNESYFDAMDIPVVLGRVFRPSDGAGAPRVVIVNQAFVRAYLEGEPPLGQRIRTDTTDWSIVGVVGDARYARVKEPIPPTVYFSLLQQSPQSAYFAVRTAVPPLTLVGAVRGAAAAVDPDIPLGRISTQLQLRDKALSGERLFSYLCGALAILALLLCCIGVYGLSAYGVARRAGEFGIRAALGATRQQITGPVVREGLMLTAIGLALGLPAAFAIARLIRSLLWGVGPADPVSLGGSSLLLLLVALMAVAAPARRAARVDPSDALRAE